MEMIAPISAEVHRARTFAFRESCLALDFSISPIVAQQ